MSKNEGKPSSQSAEFRPVSKQSLSDAVYAQLRDEIVSGRMEPGSTLPAERALSDMLQVNRGAVREALKRLEQARLVTIQHGGATRVLNFRETAGTDLLAQLLIKADGQLDTKVARSVMEMRSAIGKDITRLCAQRRADALVDTLIRVDAAMAAHHDDLAALQRDSMDFWAVLVEGADNVAYQLAFNSLRDTYAKLHEPLQGILAQELRARDHYAAIVSAIAERRAQQAASHAGQLLAIGERDIMELLDALG